MRRRFPALIALIALAAPALPAGAETTYSIDRLFGFEASFSSDPGAPSVSGWIHFVGARRIAGQGEEPPPRYTGLCASAYSRIVNTRSTRSESGCVAIYPSSDTGPLTVSETLPTTLRIYGEIPLSEPIEVRESSITVNVTWAARGSAITPCLTVGGAGAGIGQRSMMDADAFTTRTAISASGSLVSETQGSAPRATGACFAEGLSVRATADV